MSSSSVRAPVGTSPPSAPPSSASRSGWSRRSTGEGSASTSAASRRRRCCATPSWRTSWPTRRTSSGSPATPRWTSSRPTRAAARSRTRIVKGVHFLMKKNKIEEIDGWGTFIDAKTIEVKGDDGETRTVTADNVIIATGATTRLVPGTELSRERRHLRGADPHRPAARLDRDRRLRRDRRRVRLRDGQLRRRRHHRGVPRPDGAHRGRRGLQGARQALQEPRREGAAQDQGREDRGHRRRR